MSIASSEVAYDLNSIITQKISNVLVGFAYLFHTIGELALLCAFLLLQNYLPHDGQHL